MIVKARVVCRNGFRRLNRASLSRRTLVKNNIRATAEHLGSASDPAKQNGRSHYHPFEDIGDATSKKSNDATLTAAETSRTIIEVLHSLFITESTSVGMALM